MTVIHGLHLVLLALTSIIAIPRPGVRGYGLGEAAALLAFFVLIATTRRPFGLLGGSGVAVAWLVLCVALFAPLVGWWAAVPLLLTLAHPATWRIVRDLLHQWWTAWIHPAEGHAFAGRALNGSKTGDLRVSLRLDGRMAGGARRMFRQRPGLRNQGRSR